MSPQQLLGGGGGQSFEDQATDSSLKRINIRSASRVDSIECEYEDGQKTGAHGGKGGKFDIFYLEKNEAIITIFLWAGGEIDAIQFQTTQSRLSPKYGGSGGAPYVIRGNDGRRERALMGFRGRCAERVDALQPLWSSNRELGAANVIVGDARGGNGGADFQMLSSLSNPLKTALKRIQIRCAGEIDSIECQYVDGTWSGRKGGNGGAVYDFDLDINERIIRIEGRSASRIDRLQFFTNKRSSPVYGGDGGEPFIWTPPFSGSDTASDSNMSLLCFSGRAGSRLDYLAPVWAIDPPVNFTLEIEKFDDITAGNSNVGKPTEAWSSEQVTTNASDETLTTEVTWTMAALRTSTISLSKESRTKLGGKLTFEIGAKGKAGVPFVAEGEVHSKFGLEFSAEHEWKSGTTDQTANTKSYTETRKDTVKVPPKTKLLGTARGYKAVVENLKWVGTMIVTYAGGGIAKFPVDGKLDSASISRCHTTYRTEPLKT